MSLYAVSIIMTEGLDQTGEGCRSEVDFMSKRETTKTREDTVRREDGGNQEFAPVEFIFDKKLIKPPLLLHSCCGPCSAPVIEDLIREYAVTVYYYNPNITDPEEYKKRLESQEKAIKEFNGKIDKLGVVGFIEGKYEPDYFYNEVRGLENEPERGERCEVCVKLRLEKTAGAAILGGFDGFATTLSLSPHKDFNMISRIGRDLFLKYGISFVETDYRNTGGYQRSIELSKKYSLYRQKYCGCEFSKGEK